MRTTLHASELVVQAGQTTRLDIDVLNTTEVIDGVHIDDIELRGFPGNFQATHLVTNLFPDASDRLALLLEIPLHCPAGDYQVVVAIGSRVATSPVTEHRLQLRVEPRVEFAVTLRPSAVTGGRTARTFAVLTNRGNADISVSGSAIEPTRSVECTVRPNRIVVPRGSSLEYELELTGPRPWFGQPVQRSIVFTAQVDDVIIDRRDIERRQPVRWRRDPSSAIVGASAIEALGTFTQKPRIPRGLITAATLAAIVALWAAIFVLAASRFGDDQVLGKNVASAFNDEGEDDIALRDIAASRQGQVVAASTGDGIERVTVEAFRLAGGNRLVEVESVVTGTDGRFDLQSLLPGRYLLRATGVGFEPVWFPDPRWPDGSPRLARIDDADGSGVRLVELLPDGEPTAEQNVRREEFSLRTLPDAERPSSGTSIDEADAAVFGPSTIVLVGDPAVMSGTITLPPGAADTTGDDEPTVLTVTAIRADIDDASAAGVDDQPDGFARRVQAAECVIEPSSAPRDRGCDSGPVVDGSFEFRIPNLIAPATYDVTVEGPDFETQRFEQQLDAGDLTVVNTVHLAASNADISGSVVDQNDEPLGGVTVVARAGDIEIRVTTPTDADVGEFRIVDLPSPETYTITYSRDGYTEVTRSVELRAGTDLPGQDVRLIGGEGTISGRTVDAAGTPLGGIDVRVTGGDVDSTTSTLTGGEVGSFLLGDLPVPETYTLTFSGDVVESEAITVSLTAAGVSAVGDVRITSNTSTVGGVARAGSGGLGDLEVTLTDGLLPRSTTTATAPAGRFSFADVPPGSYTLTFVGRRVVTWVERFDVVAGVDVDLVVEVPLRPTPAVT